MAVGLLASGCAVEEPTSEPSSSAASEEREEREDVGTSESALDSSGRTCAGRCRTNSMDYAACGWTGALKYYVCRPNVTQNCRDRIVDYCHNRGWAFEDAWWTRSCGEGYVCPGYPI